MRFLGLAAFAALLSRYLISLESIRWVIVSGESGKVRLTEFALHAALHALYSGHGAAVMKAMPWMGMLRVHRFEMLRHQSGLCAFGADVFELVRLACQQ